MLFEEAKRATAVECIATSADGSTQNEVFYARKLIVLSAGACGSPQILERSGVGSKAVLEALSIGTVSDLPGVGENYIDHPLVIYTYKTGLKEKETLDALFTGRVSMEEAIKTKDPYLGWNGADVSSKLRPSDDEVASLGANFKGIWERDFKGYPQKPLASTTFVSRYALLSRQVG